MLWAKTASTGGHHLGSVHVSRIASHCPGVVAPLLSTRARAITECLGTGPESVVAIWVCG